MTKEVFQTDEFKQATEKADMAAGRRAFMQAIGCGAVGAVVFAAAEGLPIPAHAQAINDADILNFALNLEYLEATFYSYANSGNDIPATDTGTSGTVSGGQKARLRSVIVKAYAAEIAAEELKHVQFLRSALVAAGATPVSRPNLNIGSAFATAATAAGINGGASFSPYAGDGSFLIGSYIFEDVGVTAYKGAARLIQNKDYLEAAAGILAVEAYHAGIIRTALFALQNQTAVNNTQKISDLRSTLANGAAGVDDVGIGMNKSPTLVPVDGNAIAFSRNTDQVLNIVYGNRNPPSGTHTPGLFFPNGMNGTIK